MRKLIAAMKISVDGKVTPADWVAAWSDDYCLMPQVDACLLGGKQYPEYENYWTAIQKNPTTPIWTDNPPTPAELEYARFCEETPHYVLSNTLTSAQWPQTRFLRGLDEITTLKAKSGKDIYLVGGATTTASLIDAGLVDELRLLVYPLIAGEGKPLFGTTKNRRKLELRKVEQRPDGLISEIYVVS
jgi:dihydrofolate reductase